MKLKFDPNLEYQLEAISVIVDVFDGQAIESRKWTFRGQASRYKIELLLPF